MSELTNNFTSYKQYMKKENIILICSAVIMAYTVCIAVYVLKEKQTDAVHVIPTMKVIDWYTEWYPDVDRTCRTTRNWSYCFYR